MLDFPLATIPTVSSIGLMSNAESAVTSTVSIGIPEKLACVTYNQRFAFCMVAVTSSPKALLANRTAAATARAEPRRVRGS